jgi:glycyl-tRNA synthetase beta chain
MPELLFEIGCEEIPADDLIRLPEEFKQLSQKAFESNRIQSSDLKTYATPRRLTLVANLESMQQDLKEQRMGPARKVAFDPAGNPTPAGLGFAKSSGVPFEKLSITSTPKGEYLFAEILIAGRKTRDVLLEIIPAILKGLSFRKFMKWGSEDFSFGRPIRNLVLLFDNETIPLTVAGVSSNRFSFGHRFMGSKKIEVESFEEYEKKARRKWRHTCV